jgi:hypothetical protein
MIIAAIAATALTAACTRTVVHQERSNKPVVVSHEEGNGPPPHAPAHGYRHKHAKDDVTLVYDTGIDVYIVSGMPGCYFSAGQYYRDSGTAWEWSVSIEGPWKTVKSSTDLPPGLRAKGHDKGNKHKDENKGKGKSK